MLEDDRLNFVKNMDLKGTPHISEPSCFKSGMLKDWGSASITPPLEMCVGLCEGAKAALFLASWTAKTGRGLEHQVGGRVHPSPPLEAVRVRISAEFCLSEPVQFAKPVCIGPLIGAIALKTLHPHFASQNGYQRQQKLCTDSG